MAYLNELSLASFSPLIQLWAGICLLFFYMEFLGKSPLHDRKEKIIEKCEKCYELFVTKYQNLSPENLDLSFLPEVRESESTRWATIKTDVFNLGKFGFLHSVLVLVYIGFENFLPCKGLYPALLIVNLIALIYIVLNFFAYKSSIIQKPWLLYCCFGLMCFCLAFFLSLPEEIRERIIAFGVCRTAVTLLTLFVCILAYMIVALAYVIRDFIPLVKCNLAVRRINKLFQKWTNIPFKGVPLDLRLRCGVKLLRMKSNDGTYEKTVLDNVKDILQKEVSAAVDKVNVILKHL